VAGHAQSIDPQLASPAFEQDASVIEGTKSAELAIGQAAFHLPKLGRIELHT
jgi:hypothetical protein